MNQVGQRRSRLLESDIREWLIWASENAMVGNTRMRNLADVALLHMAACAIIRRLLLPASLKWHGAASLGMTCQALLAEVSGSFMAGRFHMRVVARNATQALPTAAIAFAQSHRVVVFEQILLRGRLAGWRYQQDCHR